MGKYLITMDNAENKNCATLSLDQAYDKFELNRETRNLSEDTIKEYRKNYRFFCEFLNYLNENYRGSNKHMQSSLY
jgi:hypothetical protein